MKKLLLKLLGIGIDNRPQNININNVEVLAPNATRVENKYTTVIKITINFKISIGLRNISKSFGGSASVDPASANLICQPVFTIFDIPDIIKDMFTPRSFTGSPSQVLELLSAMKSEYGEDAIKSISYTSSCDNICHDGLSLSDAIIKASSETDI